MKKHRILSNIVESLFMFGAIYYIIKGQIEYTIGMLLLIIISILTDIRSDTGKIRNHEKK